MGIDAVFYLIKARWKQIAAVTLAFALIGALLTSMMPRKYKAEAAFVVDSRAAELPGGQPQGFQSMLPATFLATQVDIARSERVAERTLASLPEAGRHWFQQAYEEGDKKDAFEVWATEVLAKNVLIAPSRESNVVTVSYTSPDPRVSAEVANTLVDAYIRTAVELRAQPSERYNELFEVEAKQARERLIEARDRLSAFRQKHGISVSDETLDSENQRLTDLQKELVALQSRSAETSTRAEQARRNPERLAEVMNDPVLVEMRNDLQRARTYLSEQQGQYGAQHPRIIEARKTVGELQGRIRAEAVRLAGSLDASSAADRTRIKLMEDAIDKQRKVVSTLQAARSEAATLTADADNAQSNYNAIIKGADQSRLESRSTQGSASVLEVARAPRQPSSPKRLLNLFASVFAGMLFGLMWAILQESRHGKVRSEEQALELAGQPLIGTVPRFRHNAQLSFDPRRALAGPGTRTAG